MEKIHKLWFMEYKRYRIRAVRGDCQNKKLNLVLIVLSETKKKAQGTEIINDCVYALIMTFFSPLKKTVKAGITILLKNKWYDK